MLLESLNRNKTIIEIEQMLRDLLGVGKVIFLPVPKYDPIGHADAIVRIGPDDQLLINDPSNDTDKAFHKKLRTILKKNSMKYVEIPYVPDLTDTTGMSAVGLYLNYFETNENVFVPVFDIKEDQEALGLFRKIFNKKIIPVNAIEIAKEGGCLNCVSWRKVQYL